MYLNLLIRARVFSQGHGSNIENLNKVQGRAHLILTYGSCVKEKNYRQHCSGFSNKSVNICTRQFPGLASSINNSIKVKSYPNLTP